VLPQSGDNPNAWRPKRDDSEEEFIMVSFGNPIKAKQVAIAESENPGAVSKVYAYDKDYNEYLLFELTPRALPIEKRLLNLFFQETPYEIQAIKVFLNPSVSPGYNAIDAIGISTSNIPISVLIQLAAGVASEMDAENLGENVNSEYVEHSPIISPDGKRLYFSRKYHPDNLGGADDPEDIWVSEMDPETGEWLPAKNLGEPLNTAGPNFISSISQTAEGEIFVLGNRYGKKGRMYEGISISKRQEDGSFSAPEAIEIENEYNYSPKADFFLAPGGQAMILSVERDDSYGNRDLYISFKNGNIWSEPVNMGGTINTLSEEAAPFLSEDGKTLYFSSAGYSGYGGMDIYVSRRLDDTFTRWSPPDNLGSGINTEKDDQYFSIPSTGKHLYFTRGNVDDDTDIFRFEVQEFFIDPSAPIASSVKHLLDEIEQEDLIAAKEKENKKEEDILITISGKVINPETNEPIPNVDVVVERLPDGVDIGVTKTNDEGYYEFKVKKGARYGVTPQLKGYLGESENFDFNDTEESQTVVADLNLKPIEKDKPVVINNIFFAFDKDELTTASYPELERILEYLKNGEIKRIEIAGHTDATGPEAYNEDLSRRRARSVYNFFLESGIDASRLSAKGYGETQPVATNDTVEGRRQNRRVEFKILEK
jgi:outer membrane protein OmpA-like peptidoglycan-associated protein